MYTAGNKLGVILSTFVLIGMDQADLNCPVKFSMRCKLFHGMQRES